MLSINGERLLRDLDALAQVGVTADGGVTRPALSEADIAGRAWFKAQVEAEGFAFRSDGAGNLSAVLPSADPTARTLLIGSHLDSVPNGGRYDGALGVLAALEVLRTLRDSGLTLPVHVEAISFTDEEGHIKGLLGSSAVAGLLSAEDLTHVRGSAADFDMALARAGLTRDSVLAARRDPDSLLAYLELHIEQGSRLEEAGVNIGVVTAIVGLRAKWLHFTGEARHAGTTPMDIRQDALWGASAFIQQARVLVQQAFSPGVVNFGLIEARPGAFNIIPGEVRLAMEFRHGSDALLDAMETRLLSLAQQIAESQGLGLEVHSAGRYIPAEMHEHVMQAVEGAAERLGLSHTRLFSFAGHDPQTMAKIIPAGMFFIPSVGGISHSPQEYSRPEDVINGANMLLHAALSLAESAV